VVKWARTASDVFHYSEIGQQCLKAMHTLRPFLILTLRDKTTVRGWLEGLRQGNNAVQEDSQFPTAWYGSIVLRADERDAVFDFLDVETVRASLPPVHLFAGIEPIEA
jgi:hypothetical protein